MSRRAFFMSTIQSGFEIPPAPSYVLKFSNRSASGTEDQANYFDALGLLKNGAGSPALQDTGFEAYQVAGDYEYNPPTPFWQFNATSGLSTGGGAGNPFFALNHQARQIAFLYGTAAVMQQNLLLDPGIYSLGIPFCKRVSPVDNVDLVTDVHLNDILLATLVPGPSAYFGGIETPKFRIFSS